LYRDPARALTRVPILAMLARSLDDLRARAESLRKCLPDGFSIVDTEASVGGGAFPNARIPSVGLAYEREPQALEKRLRAGRPAVVARIADGRLLLDLRTVRSDDELADAVRAALA
jgi:L-seryl-tRNA(Ser) seleniumtransferase